jgi:DNA-binding ferritin-like protein (Dps family)
MKKEIKEYLESLENKFETNENYYQAYKMIGSKIIDLGIASTQKGLNELISDSIDEMIKENILDSC